jgi:hypothetical protein
MWTLRWIFLYTFQKLIYVIFCCPLRHQYDIGVYICVLHGREIYKCRRVPFERIREETSIINEEMFWKMLDVRDYTETITKEMRNRVILHFWSCPINLSKCLLISYIDCWYSCANLKDVLCLNYSKARCMLSI